MTACYEAPPGAAEKARLSLAMDKMEAGQAESDVARANAHADAGQGTGIGTAPDTKTLDH